MAYLDHAATTPMLPEAIGAMTAQLSVTGNASSLHAAGRRARRTVEESREALADSLGARPSEVVFTSGGTEADNLAVKGLYWSRRDADPRRTRVLAGPVEHHAVLDAVDWLAEHEGANVDYLPVDRHGRVHPEDLREAILKNPDDIAMITVMWANNEIGTIMPVRELAAVAAEFGIPMHADAVQAFGQLEVDFARSGLAAMTVSGHKIGGPFGIGALLLGRDHTPVPVLHGGGQERHVRSGTLDVPAVASFAVAGRLAAERREEFARRVGGLRDELVTAVRLAVPDAVLGGDPDPAGRLPANAHFSFPGCEGDSLLLLLDAQGIECSTGSACTAGIAQPSHVLLATGTDPDLARGTLRFSLGHTSTEDDVKALAEAIGPAVERARTAGLS
ncbi:cysteine desulfurase [Streptomyces filamentosus]|uniref:Cysteine desulfurase n=2 Tax=Streptomyces filamentosus TaxID=67294 RepID=A0ABY4URA8_STRFL|nr:MULTISPECIES: cysteine desulfurase family protein [Streptomyces]MYV63152.1 aminotransferase class V-fold PLP-dependent enzyme [Streptomyces sp. SID4931]SCG06692.1 cysteine desulfurase [Streptomyces sp. Ncost-T6T-2b]EFE77786.1 pyridoxal-phosphate-dependent aminotransferase [Streptomyces filamentosus NRRL 15998]EWS94711.1 cysteine desulfurase NifS [Streptomyces filamentosus NRRL 11379]MYR81700.1 aminotransferase class V-fold PLP-dependent enzyme [Streptomyces sp. SID5466]